MDQAGSGTWKQRKSQGRLVTLITLVALMASFMTPAFIKPAQAALGALGPVDLETEYPTWYEDANGLRLQPCLEGLPMCSSTRAELLAEEGEAFYMLAIADISGSGLSGMLEVALEAATFGGSTEKSVFSRYRLRLNIPAPGTYVVTYPYGQRTYNVASAGTRAINDSDDVGCFGITGNSCFDGLAPNYEAALTGEVGPFLQWDPTVAPAAPAGYIGDNVTPHKVIGSPTGNNFVRITGPNGLVFETDLFTLEGKKADGASKPDLVASSDSGASNADNITNVTSPAFTGNSGAGRTVNLYVDGVLRGNATTGANAIYTVTPSSPLAEGVHSVTTTEVNPGGAESAQSPALSITVDTTMPASTALGTSSPASPANNNSPKLVGTAEAGSAVRIYTDLACTAVAATGTAAAFAAPGLDVSVANDSTTTYYATATDVAGNTSACSASGLSYVEDSTPATVSINTPKPSNPTNDNTPTFNITSEADATVECSLSTGAEAYGVCPPGGAYGTQDAGNYTFKVRATDAAGNSRVVSHAFVIDTVNPTVQITSEPALATNVASTSFSFSHPDAGSTFECAFGTGNPATFAACASPKAYAPTADGIYTFKVRATDSTGSQSLERVYTFAVDRTAPTVSLSTTPKSLTNIATPSFGFSSDEAGSTFECALSAGTANFGPCPDSGTYPAQPDGTYTFKVRAIDTAGNPSPATSFTFAIDTTAPLVSVDGKPAPATNDNTPTFTFSGEPNATFACSLSKGSDEFQACPAGGTYPAQPDGIYTFKVRATDAAGNNAVDTYSFDIDTVAPRTVIDLNPGLVTRFNSPAFTFSSPDGGLTFACSLSTTSDVFGPCPADNTYAAQPDGHYTFKVRATDAAGNTGAPAAYTFDIDTAAPHVTLDGVPGDPTATKNPSFSFSSDPGARFECALSSNPSNLADCASPKSYSAVRDGTYTFSVRAIDTAGNVGPVSQYTFVIDTVPSPVTITDMPANLTNNASPTFDFSASKAGRTFTFECSLSTGTDAFQPCVAPKSYGAHPSGIYTFKVRATDNAGNVTEASDSFQIDAVAPAASLDTMPDNPTNNTSPSFSFSATEGNVTYECSLSKSIDSFASCSSPQSYGPLSNGTWTFKVRARDAAGNIGAPTTGYSFNVDTVAPLVTLSTKPLNPTNNTSPSFAFTTNEPGTTFQCSLSTGADLFTSCGAPGSVSYGPGLIDATYTFKVRATDTAGNSSIAGYSFVLDTVAPTAFRKLAINNGAAYTTAGLVTLNTAARDARSLITHVRVSNSPSMNGSMLALGHTSAYTTTRIWTLVNATYGGSTVNGPRNVYLQWRDQAGNWSDPLQTVAQDSIFLDTVAPVAQPPVASIMPASTVESNTVRVRLIWPAATDNASGVARYVLEQSSNNGVTYTPVALSVPTARSTTLALPSGKFLRFRVQAVDRAGRVSAWSYGPKLSISLANETSRVITYAGTWKTEAVADAVGGAVRHTSTSTNSARFTFTGSNVALTAPKGTDRGRATVLIDGVPIGTLDLYSAAPLARQVVFSRTGLAPKADGTPHTIEVRVLGSKNGASTGTRVDVDAFITMP